MPVRRSLSFAATILLAAVIGAGLLAAALPRTLAAFARLSGDPLMSHLADGKELSEADYGVLAESRRHAIGHAASAEDYSELALAELGLAAAAGAADPATARALYEAAREAAREAVRRNPADGYGWMRLAYANYYLDGVAPPLARALEMTLKATPFDLRLVYVTVEFALTAWPELSEEARARAETQIRFAVRWDPARVARAAKRHFAQPIVRRALFDNPGMLAEFDRVYRSL